MTDVAESPDKGMTYEETLRYSQRVRKQVVEHYTAGGSIPSDNRDVGMLLKALSDMDNTALTERKNAIEQNGADSSKKIADALMYIVNNQRNKNPFQRQNEEEAVGVLPEIDVEQLGEYEITPGETEIGVISESSDDFIRRMEEQK